MANKLSQEKIERINELYNQGLNPIEISREMEVSHSTVYEHTKVKQRINPETREKFKSLIEYREYLIKQRGFDSRIKYREYLAKQKGFASRTEYEECIAKQKGFASRKEYREHLIKQKGFESRIEYRKDLAKQKGFNSRKEYQEYLAKQKGFASRTEYGEHLAKERQKNPINKILSVLIIKRLDELDKNQDWLAKELGINSSAITRYTDGKTIPRKNLQEKFFIALNLPYKTLDEMVNNNGNIS